MSNKYSFPPTGGAENIHCQDGNLDQWTPPDASTVGNACLPKTDHWMGESPWGATVYAKPSHPVNVLREVVYSRVGAALGAPTAKTYGLYNESDGGLYVASEMRYFQTMNSSDLTPQDMSNREGWTAFVVTELLTYSMHSPGDICVNPSDGSWYVIDHEWGFGPSSQGDNNDVSDLGMDLDACMGTCHIRRVRDLGPALLRVENLSGQDIAALVRTPEHQLGQRVTDYHRYLMKLEADRIIELMQVRRPRVRGWLTTWISNNSTSALWLPGKKPR